MIIPGILETNFDEAKTKAELVGKHAPVIQIDIADGRLVDGRTFLEIEKIDSIDTKAAIELHLMVRNPLKYLKTKAKRIVAHVEGENVVDFIDESKNKGFKPALALNPDTSIEAIEPFLQNLSFVQFMTIVPGGQGRKLDKSVLKKIVLFKKKYPKVKIQVDGGVNKENLESVLKTGVDDIVIGSAIVKADDPVKALKEFQGQIKKHER